MGLFSRRRTNEPVAPVRPLSTADLDEVRFLITTGKIVYAVKLVRDRTGLGLKEAKGIVDDIRKGRYVPSATGPSTGPKPGTSLAVRARALKAGGDWHTAAALVMVETGMTESEAGRFLAALEG
jgi:hypothetical protein